MSTHTIVWDVNYQYMEENKGIKFEIASATEAKMDDGALFIIRSSNTGFGWLSIIKLDSACFLFLGLGNIAIWRIF